MHARVYAQYPYGGREKRRRIWHEYRSHGAAEIQSIVRAEAGGGQRDGIRVHRRSRGITNEARRITAVSGVR